MKKKIIFSLLFITCFFINAARAEGVIYHLGNDGLCNHTQAQSFQAHFHDGNGILKYEFSGNLNPGGCYTGTLNVDNLASWGYLTIQITNFDTKSIIQCHGKFKGGYNNTSHEHSIKDLGCDQSPNHTIEVGHGDHTFNIDINQ